MQRSLWNGHDHDKRERSDWPFLNFHHRKWNLSDSFYYHLTLSNFFNCRSDIPSLEMSLLASMPSVTKLCFVLILSSSKCSSSEHKSLSLNFPLLWSDSRSFDLKYVTWIGHFSRASLRLTDGGGRPIKRK